MSDPSTNAGRQNLAQKSLPAWITAGVMGLALGGGACFVAMYYHYAPAAETSYQGPYGGGGPPGGGMGAPGGGGGPPGAGMGAPGGGGGPPGGGGGAPGGGGGPRGGGAGGPPRGKRALTSIVGKLDLASKGISFKLDDDQSAKLATKLAELEKLEMISNDQAQERAEAIEALLTEEQKETLALFEMARPANASGAGSGGGGAPARVDGPDVTNPFRQEANPLLRSLLDRLKGAAPDASAAHEAKAEEGSTAKEEGAAKEASDPKADEAKTETQETAAP